MTQQFWTVRRLTRLALLIALSAVGAYIKIPSITGTPALDSAPGYFAALAFTPGEGALVAAIGHLLTALTAGLPLSLPIHLLIALGMAGCATAVSLLRRAGRLPAIIGGILLNGVVFPALFVPLPGFGAGFFTAMVVPLVIASALNIILAVAAQEALARSRVLQRAGLGR